MREGGEQMKLIRLLATAALLWATASPATAGGERPDLRVVPVITFPHDENPPYGFDVTEGIAISPRRNLYVGMNIGGQLYKVAPDGEVSLLADFVEEVDDSNLLGLAVDADENVYAAVWGYNDPSLNGVWRVDPTGHKELVLPIPGAYWGSIPNALAFDRRGNLYVTDSGSGSIWRLEPNGDSGPWLQDDLLQGDFFGANGIAYRKRSLWVLNYDRGRIVRIPIERDGSPGQPEIFVEHPLLVGADGGQFDVLGNMYIGVFVPPSWPPPSPGGYVARVSPRGEVEIFMTAEQLAPFSWPINPVFGFGRDRTTVYMTGTNPDVAKVDVGIPGMLLPQFSHPHRRHRD
jgi:sugar lactone lactonase YvrE